MKTKNLFKIFLGYALLVLAFCLTGCRKYEYPGPPSDGFVVRSVNFYFTDVTVGQQQCVYGYCDSDGCCDTPAEQVDTFRLMSDHLYFCSFELNGEDLQNFKAGTGELAQEYFFSFSPDDGLDLIIESPEMEAKNYTDFSSNWTTGNPGTGTVDFRIGHCPDNFVENICYEISLPVIIELSGGIN